MIHKRNDKQTKCMCNVGCFSGTSLSPAFCFVLVRILEFSSFYEVWTVKLHISSNGVPAP